MSNKPVVPIFKAERMHVEVIQGNYFVSRGQAYIEVEEGGAHPVKPETLKMSLDGKTFYSMEQIELAVAFAADTLEGFADEL